jgi:hypothetical protein
MKSNGVRNLTGGEKRVESRAPEIEHALDRLQLSDRLDLACCWLRKPGFGSWQGQSWGRL